MHPAQIQAKIKIAGLTQRRIADDLSVSPFHISEVIHKKRPSDRVMKHIARVINRQPQEVFPEYYFRKNRRKRRSAINTADKPSRNTADKSSRNTADKSA